MAQAAKLRVGVIGAGYWAQRAHLPLFQGHAESEVVAIASRTPEKAHALAAQFGVPRVCATADELLALPGVDAVTIATPNDSHHALALAAIGAGKHVFCEKPLAINYAQAAEMRDAARAAGVATMVCFTTRFMPGIELAKQVVASGELGELYHANATFFVDQALQDRIPLTFWRFDKSVGGTGVIGDMAAHTLDRLIWWLGDVDQVCAQSRICRSQQLTADLAAPRAVTTEDYCGMLLRFASGVQATASVSRVVARTMGIQFTEVHGSRGSLVYDGDPYRVRVTLYGEKERVLAADGIPADESRWREIVYTSIRRMFVDGAGAGMPIEADFAQGARVQGVLDAAERSAVSNVWEPVAQA